MLSKMTTSDVIRIMIEGLENPLTDEIDMSTFGSKIGETCYGCAATNTICRMLDVQPKDTFDSNGNAKYGDGYDNPMSLYDTLHAFEIAIDELRQGNLKRYNDAIRISSIGLNNLLIPEEFVDTAHLQCLTSRNYQNHLDEYQDFAEMLKEYESTNSPTL